MFNLSFWDFMGEISTKSELESCFKKLTSKKLNVCSAFLICPHYFRTPLIKAGETSGPISNRSPERVISIMTTMNKGWGFFSISLVNTDFKKQSRAA